MGAHRADAEHDRPHGERQDIVALECSIRLDGDELTYTIRMAAVGHVLQYHLGATLRRTPA